MFAVLLMTFKSTTESMDEMIVLEMLSECHSELLMLGLTALFSFNHKTGDTRFTQKECDGIVCMNREDYTNMCESWLDNVQRQLGEFVQTPFSIVNEEWGGGVWENRQVQNTLHCGVDV